MATYCEFCSDLVPTCCVCGRGTMTAVESWERLQRALDLGPDDFHWRAKILRAWREWLERQTR
jgi:hypothetical protein